MLISLKLIDHLFLSLPLDQSSIGTKSPCWKRWDVRLLSEILTRQGFEVESQTRRGEAFEKVVVGRILSAERHPKADKLQVCQVQTGPEDVRQIVCGAPNARAGLFVAVALPGAQLPGGLEIKVSKIRDVESCGMLCSREELSLAVEQERDGLGIWELHNGASCGLPESKLQELLGEPVFYALDLDDVLFELNVTPNRPDLLGHEGAARELLAGLKWSGVSAIEMKPWRSEWMGESTPEQIVSEAQERKQLKTKDGVFSAENTLGAPTFFVALDDVRVSHSPGWLRNYLEALGQKSINSVVDAGNLILLCFAQPNHAFDVAKLNASSEGERRLTIRFAQESELFLGLDGKERSLVRSDCVVADEKTVQALLGVIGGEKSKVDTDSRSLVLEFANPHPVLVRRTSRRHGRKTDSSFAFEKGIDPFRRAHAAQKLVGLISALQPQGASKVTYIGASAARVVQSISPDAHSFFPHAADAVKQIDASWQRTEQDFFVQFYADDLTRRVGADLISFDKQIFILRSLGFNVVQESDLQRARVCVPSWRRLDVVAAADLVEEIVRVVGIDHVPALPMNSVGRVQPDDRHLSFFEVTANKMVSLGYHETAGFHFMRSDDWKKLNQPHINACGEPVALLNPIIKDEPLMQTTLLGGLLRKVAFNLNYGNKRGQLFEISRTFQNVNVIGERVFADNGIAVSLQEQLSSAPQAQQVWEYAADAVLPLSHEADANTRPGETPRVCGVVFGVEEEKEWLNSSERGWTFHRIAAHVYELLSSVFDLQVEFVSLPHEHPMRSSLHPGRSAHVVVKDASSRVPLGWVGQFHPSALRNFEIEDDSLGFELNLATAFKICTERLELQKVAGERRVQSTKAPQVRLPIVERDFAFLVDEKVEASLLVTALTRAVEEDVLIQHKIPARLLGIKIFDVYRGQGTRVGEKSIALRLTLLPLERTLVEADITAVSEAVVNAAKLGCGAQLRG